MGWDGEHDADCEPRQPCECGRGTYHSCEHSSCYECFLDRRSDYVSCIYCDRWHSPDFDTCFKCGPKGRDEAARDLKLVILARDFFACGYCGLHQGDMQVDPRKETDEDDGWRPAVLHVDHIKPCAHGGTADPWNLHVLCGVCNVSKAREWHKGGRHERRLAELMDAYLTYLHDFLTTEEQARLRDDFRELYGYGEDDPDDAAQRIIGRYVTRVKAQRPRPAVTPGVVVEDIPAEYAHLDLLSAANGKAAPDAA